MLSEYVAEWSDFIHHLMLWTAVWCLANAQKRQDSGRGHSTRTFLSLVFVVWVTILFGSFLLTLIG